jgi:hypothetical protein
MAKILLGVLFTLHGLIHAALAATRVPDDPAQHPRPFFIRSRPLSALGLSEAASHFLGLALAALASLGFIASGLGLFGVPFLASSWRAITVESAIISILLILLFWHPLLVIGLIVDAAILASPLWLQWPPPGLFGQ